MQWRAFALFSVCMSLMLRLPADTATPLPRSDLEDPVAARALFWSGVSNVRDLGGLPGMEGRVVRRGLVFRSAGLNDNAKYLDQTGKLLPMKEWKGPGAVRIKPEAREFVTGCLGVRIDLDLRSEVETFGMTNSPLGEKVRWIRIPSSEYDGLDTEKGRKAFADDFKLFLDEKNYPILFHCIAGADRTGSLATVLNGILGVAPELLHRDWQYTWTGARKPPAPPPEQRWQRLMSMLSRYEGATLNEKMEKFVVSCGFTADDIARFRAIMLEPKAARQ